MQLPEMRENGVNATRKVAIAGAGPAGLTCAYFLARLGYCPKVFEAEAQPGGMLVQTIPAYRLPREELAREIRMIERMGVEIETNTKLGADFTLESLRDEGYEAVFLGLGAPFGSRLGIPNEDAEGVTGALRFLKEYNLAGKAETGKNVVVVGGGNAAVDAARTALRLGAHSVTILYRRTREEMPAFNEEILEAEREGVLLKELVAPIEIVVEDGRVAGVRCNRMQLGPFDRSGRRRPEACGGEPFLEHADQVIAAVGQRLDMKIAVNGVAVEMNEWNCIKTDPASGQTSIEWLFAGGDASSGPASVADAIGAGERAAVGIDRYLTGAEHAFWREMDTVDTDFDPEADPVDRPRAKINCIPVSRRKHNFLEVELPLTENMAVREARRCLRCDYCAEAPPQEENREQSGIAVSAG